MNIEEAYNTIKKSVEAINTRPYATKAEYEKVECIKVLLTAYEEKCKELKKEIQDDLDVRNRWGLTLQELEKEKEKNKKAIDFINDKNNYFEDGENWQNILKIKEILEE